MHEVFGRLLSSLIGLVLSQGGTHATVVRRQAEIQTYGFRAVEVQVAVGLWRKARRDSAGVFTRAIVFVEKI